MHHSFLEYYAAVGFIKEPEYLENASLVVLSPRWREVVTLMFGLLSEQGDISEFLREIAKERDPADIITGSRLSVALDCALECDVPPLQAQHLLGELLETALTMGAGSVVADARAALAVKVQELIQNTGSIPIKDSLIRGIESADERIAAANIDFVARMPLVVADDAELRRCLTQAFARRESIVRIACIAAIQGASSLRTSDNLAQVRHSLDRGSIPERHAALQLLDSEPALISEFSGSVLECINNKNRLIANLAARCVIAGGVFAQSGYEDRGLLNKALRMCTQAEGPQKRLDKYVEFSTETLEGLIFSGNAEDQKLGIRSLIAIQREPATIHGYLFSVLRASKSHEVRTACLEASKRAGWAH